MSVRNACKFRKICELHCPEAHTCQREAEASNYCGKYADLKKLVEEKISKSN